MADIKKVLNVLRFNIRRFELNYLQDKHENLVNAISEGTSAKSIIFGLPLGIEDVEEIMATNSFLEAEIGKILAQMEGVHASIKTVYDLAAWPEFFKLIKQTRNYIGVFF